MKSSKENEFVSLHLMFNADFFGPQYTDNAPSNQHLSTYISHSLETVKKIRVGNHHLYFKDKK